MIVLDASALLEFLLQTPLGTRVEARLFRDGDEFHSPHLVDVEVAQGLRRLVRTGEVSRGRAADAIADLTDFDLHRHPHLDFLNRAWKLRLRVFRRGAPSAVAPRARCWPPDAPTVVGPTRRQQALG